VTKGYSIWRPIFFLLLQLVVRTLMGEKLTKKTEAEKMQNAFGLWGNQAPITSHSTIIAKGALGKEGLGGASPKTYR